MNLQSVPEDVLSKVMTKELVFHLERRNFAVIQGIHMADAGLVAAVRQSGAVAETVEWFVPGPDTLPFAGTWKVIDGLWQLERLVQKAVRIDKAELVKYVVSGNDVGAVFGIEGYARGTGRPFATEVVRIYTLDEGRIVRIRSAYDTAAVAGAVAGCAPARPETLLEQA